VNWPLWPNATSTRVARETSELPLLASSIAPSTVIEQQLPPALVLVRDQQSFEQSWHRRHRTQPLAGLDLRELLNFECHLPHSSLQRRDVRGELLNRKRKRCHRQMRASPFRRRLVTGDQLVHLLVQGVRQALQQSPPEVPRKHTPATRVKNRERGRAERGSNCPCSPSTPRVATRADAETRALRRDVTHQGSRQPPFEKGVEMGDAGTRRDDDFVRGAALAGLGGRGVCQLVGDPVFGL
jgi:hypothetical protein